MRTAIAAITFTFALTGYAAGEQAQKIDLMKYFRSPAALSAAAAASAQLGGCPKPLKVSEYKTEKGVRLQFDCVGGEDDEASVSIEFIQFDDGVLVPSKFSFAG